MRVSPLKSQLAGAGAVFENRCGVEVAARFTDRQAECAAVRNAAGLSDFSFLRAFSLPEDKAIEYLDLLVAGNVPKTRFGRVLHTFLADEQGMVASDCFIANNDQEFVLLCESIVTDAELDALLSQHGTPPPGTELSLDHAILSVDGYKAWEVVKRLFGGDVLGLPYLSIENYTFEGERVRLIRAGKTSEFGYLLIVPNKAAPALFQVIQDHVKELGGQLCGVEAHDDLRLEGRFFNIFAEGRRVRDPLSLGLQWMADFEKEQFSGSAAIKERRAKGLENKVIGIAADGICDGLKTGARVFHKGHGVAEVVADTFSTVSGRSLALALFPKQLAYSGLRFQLGAMDGPAVRSISMPPIMPKSLTVKLDEL